LRRQFNGAKHITEAVDVVILRDHGVVGERCINRRSVMVMLRGGDTSEDAGMSNDKTDEKSVRRKLKVSWVKVIFPG
jgi:hypothetical protein